MTEAFHYYSGDLTLSATGDLLITDTIEESKQRVIRRLMTNPQDYLWQPGYGAGLPSYVGAVLDQAELSALITAQMYQEGSVVHDPQPNINLQAIPNGVSAQILYSVGDAETLLTFSVNP